MNISKLFNTNDINVQVLLTQGFQNSEFYNNNISLDTLFKDIIQMFINNDNSVVYNRNNSPQINPQNGLMKKQTKPTTTKTSPKNITFGSDLKIILNNLIGLLGYELSICILSLSLYPTIIKRNIDDLLTAETYQELLMLINNINNCYNKCNINDNSINNNNMNFVYDNNDKTKYIVSKLQLRISNNNIVSLESDKQECYQIMLDKFNNISFNNMYVNTIDELCVELGKYKPCYDNYFMKIWELLFKETYCDMYEFENIYPKFTTNNNQTVIEIPFITMLHSYAATDQSIYNIIGNIDKQIISLKQYFKNITKKTIMSIDDQDNHINVCINDLLYEHLAVVFINMLVIYAKNITILHDYTKNLGKSAVKLQFMEMFDGMKYTTPTLITYTESQLMCLHYIMLTKRDLDDVYNTDKNTETKKSRSTTKSKTATKTTKTNNKNNKQ